MGLTMFSYLCFVLKGFLCLDPSQTDVADMWISETDDKELLTIILL